MCRLALATVAALGACAQAPPTEPPPAPAQPSIAPATSPATFLAKLLSLEGCAPGEALFAIPWQHSPLYDPNVPYVRTPDPVPLCVAYPAMAAAASVGQVVYLQRVDGHYGAASVPAPPAIR